MMDDWFSRKVLIIGAARQGTALARYLAWHGAQVVLSDIRKESELRAEQEALQEIPGAVWQMEWTCSAHPLNLLDGVDLVCLSGGVPPTIPLAVEAQGRGIELSNDSQIFLDHAPCMVIGITGSAGKTTTTSLVGEIVKTAYREFRNQNGSKPARVWVGGNIGSPLIADLDEMDAADLAVMELSSFQLELMSSSPQVAVVLNVTPNHLDRHGSMEVYSRIKARILAYQAADDTAILGREDPVAWNMAQNVHGRLLSFGLQEPGDDQQGTYLRDGGIWLRLNDLDEDILLLEQEDVLLRGEHNLLNVLAACAITAAVGTAPAAIQIGVRSFEGISHRLEHVRSWHGADWYNDSIATAPERTIAAIRSFDEPLVLLAGGRDKKLPWDTFAALTLDRVDHLILFGEAADTIDQAINKILTVPSGREQSVQFPNVTRCRGLQEAVKAAAEIAETGDVVLLSPGGTSFDEFRDFEERGECFVRLVRDLA